MQPDLVRSWYVLHTKSRFENVVSDGLARKSIEAFLPKHNVRSKRRDRKAIINVPLFAGYVFVKASLDPYERVEILKTTGVVRMIGNKQGKTRPATLADAPIPNRMIRRGKMAGAGRERKNSSGSSIQSRNR